MSQTQTQISGFSSTNDLIACIGQVASRSIRRAGDIDETTPNQDQECVILEIEADLIKLVLEPSFFIADELLRLSSGKRMFEGMPIYFQIKSPTDSFVQESRYS